MIDVQVHFRGVGSERQRLPAVPAVGSYRFGPSDERRLWRVSAVVVDGKTVDVYAIEVSARLAGELTAAWTTWDQAFEPSKVDS